MTRITLVEGQEVWMKNDDGGLMRGKVTGFESDGKQAVITPDDPALQKWYPKGYLVGATHWGTYVIPLPECTCRPLGGQHQTGCARRGPTLKAQELRLIT